MPDPHPVFAHLRFVGEAAALDHVEQAAAQLRAVGQAHVERAAIGERAVQRAFGDASVPAFPAGHVREPRPHRGGGRVDLDPAFMQPHARAPLADASSLRRPR
ncbi:MAG: hypothetical protein U1F20_00220 [Lysobacterales bacterium]